MDLFCSSHQALPLHSSFSPEKAGILLAKFHNALEARSRAQDDWIMTMQEKIDSMREVRDMFVNASLEPAGNEFTSSIDRLLDVRREQRKRGKELILQIPCFAHWADVYAQMDSLKMEALSPRYDNGGLSITDAALLRSIFNVRSIVCGIYSS